MPRKRIKGKVVSLHGNTAKVEYVRVLEHPILKKRNKHAYSLLAHVDGFVPNVGDEVIALETPPVSKRKRWLLVQEGSAS